MHSSLDRSLGGAAELYIARLRKEQENSSLSSASRTSPSFFKNSNELELKNKVCYSADDDGDDGKFQTKTVKRRWTMTTKVIGQPHPRHRDREPPARSPLLFASIQKVKWSLPVVGARARRPAAGIYSRAPPPLAKR